MESSFIESGHMSQRMRALLKERLIIYLTWWSPLFFHHFYQKPTLLFLHPHNFFNGLGGYFVSALKRTPWVLEIRDLWPESIVAVGAITNNRIIHILEWMEKLAYQKATHIIPVTDSFQAYMLKKGIPKEKITVIKNGVDLGKYNPEQIGAEFHDDLGLKNKFVASYVGTHGMAHHLATILHAAQELLDYPQIHFLLVGDGAERKHLLQLCQSMHLRNVTMLEQLPKERMPHLWSISDVSLVVLKKSDLFLTVIPSKMFESMAMQTPIILGVEGESADLLRTAKAGLTIEPEDAKALARTTLHLYNNPTLCQELGENGRHYVAQFFDRTLLARRYSQVLQALSD